jgi:hypothetical protein
MRVLVSTLAALAIYGGGLAMLVPNADAEVTHGPTGPHRPGPKVKKCTGNWIVRWCPDGFQIHIPSARRSGTTASQKVRCRRLHKQYLVHHPTDAPRRLEHVHGCRRYKLDARFHRNETNNPLLGAVNRLWEAR